MGGGRERLVVTLRGTQVLGKRGGQLLNSSAHPRGHGTREGGSKALMDTLGLYVWRRCHKLIRMQCGTHVEVRSRPRRLRTEKGRARWPECACVNARIPVRRIEKGARRWSRTREVKGSSDAMLSQLSQLSRRLDFSKQV